MTNKPLTNNRIIQIAITIIVSIILLTVLFGCSGSENKEPQSSTQATSTQEAEVDKERANAEQAAQAIVKKIFSSYMEQSTEENTIFALDQEVKTGFTGDNLEVEVRTALIFGEDVAKSIWDSSLANQIELLSERNSMYSSFRDMLQEQTDGYLKFCQDEGNLSSDWSGKFNVVMIVTNGSGEILAEYR